MFIQFYMFFMCLYIVIYFYMFLHRSLYLFSCLYMFIYLYIVSVYLYLLYLSFITCLDMGTGSAFRLKSLETCASMSTHVQAASNSSLYLRIWHFVWEPFSHTITILSGISMLQASFHRSARIARFARSLASRFVGISFHYFGEFIYLVFNF